MKKSTHHIFTIFAFFFTLNTITMLMLFLTWFERLCSNALNGFNFIQFFFQFYTLCAEKRRMEATRGNYLGKTEVRNKLLLLQKKEKMWAFCVHSFPALISSYLKAVSFNAYNLLRKKGALSSRTLCSLHYLYVQLNNMCRRRRS